jgi:hypothetical protein
MKTYTLMEAAQHFNLPDIQPLLVLITDGLLATVKIQGKTRLTQATVDAYLSIVQESARRENERQHERQVRARTPVERAEDAKTEAYDALAAAQREVARLALEGSDLFMQRQEINERYNANVEALKAARETVTQKSKECESAERLLLFNQRQAADKIKTEGEPAVTGRRIIL